ncbi:MAG: hypothetical protein R2849_02300 [Thermomicrobiales bacterium]
MATSTRELVEIALEMAGMDELPARQHGLYQRIESEQGHVRDRYRSGRALTGAGAGCDAVIAHHPAGGESTLRFPEVLHKQIDFMIDHTVSMKPPLVRRLSR